MKPTQMKKPDPQPWKLEYRWKSEEDYMKYCYKSRNTAYTQKWISGGSRYRTRENMERTLKREFTPYYDSMAGGREWRVINKETQEVLTVIIEAKSITLI